MTKKRLSDLVREEVTKEGETEEVAKVTSPSQSDPKIAELAEALAIATEKADKLQNLVIALESELETQRNLVKTFQQQLQQQEDIETAFAEQKEVNSHLSTQLKEMQTELEEEKQLVEKLYTELQKRQPQPIIEPIKESLPTQQLSLKRTSPSRPTTRFVAPNSDSTILSNEDIGWFD